jgi:hypothetical protein
LIIYTAFNLRLIKNISVILDVWLLFKDI